MTNVLTDSLDEIFPEGFLDNLTDNDIGELQNVSGNGSDGQVLTSTGSGVAWEDAGGGDLNFGGDTFGADKVIGSNDDYDMTFETNNTARLNLANGGEIHTGAETSGGTELSAGGL